MDRLDMAVESYLVVIVAAIVLDMEPSRLVEHDVVLKTYWVKHLGTGIVGGVDPATQAMIRVVVPVGSSSVVARILQVGRLMSC